MKHRVRTTAAIMAFALLPGCATTLPEARKEAPRGLSVRLPVAVAATVNIESQPFLVHPERPLSVADESRGRWLTLFEVNYSPAKPPSPSPHPVYDQEPSR